MKRIFVLAAVAACSSDHAAAPPPPPPPATDPVPDPMIGSGFADSRTPDAHVETDAAADAAGSGFATAAAESTWPVEQKPPAPFDRFRPYMKQADVLAAIADAGIQPKSWPSSRAIEHTDGTTYAAPIPGGIVGFQYDSTDRLIRMFVFGPSGGELSKRVLAAWPKLNGVADPFHSFTTYEWPSTATGWTVKLEAERHPDPSEPFVMDQGYELVQYDATWSDAGQPTFPGDKLWPALAKIVGGPLDAAHPLLGSALVRESDDDEDLSATAERTDRHQGYARVATPYDSTAWQIVFRLDATGARVAEIDISGHTDEESSRVALFSSLKKAYGPPRTEITDAGRMGIAFSTGTVDVHIAEAIDDWSITLRPRP